MHRRLLGSIAALCCLAAGPLPTLPAPPPVQPVVEQLWGTSVSDRYRYFEDASDPRTQAYFSTQNTYTRALLNALDGPRERLAKRIRQLDRSSISVSEVMRVGDRYFYQRQGPQDEARQLFTRAVGGTLGTRLVDPMLGGHAASHRTIDWQLPSLDGRYVAYGISSGGSENSVLHVVDVASGKTLPEAIDRTRFGATGWLPDGRSFFYLRLPLTTDATPVTERERYARVYLHKIGTPLQSDRPVFGYGHDPHVPILPDDIPSIAVSPQSPYAIAAIEHGVRNELTIYAAPVAAVSGGHAHWTKIADIADDVTGYDVHGSTIYLLSHKTASNFSVISLDLHHPDINKAITAVAAGSAVIQQVGVAADALYLRLLDGGIGRIARIPFDTAPRAKALAHTIELPYNGAVIGMTTDPLSDGITFGLTGWTRSLLWYRLDVDRLVDTKLKPISPIDTAPYVSLETKARSSDGTLIPLSIIMKRGTILDGSHPAYLEGYGAYGITLDPYFSATRIAWLERGGVYAVAHVRGGGEFGDAWHRAAMRTTKARSIDDYIACAKYLIKNGYTSPDHLGGEGTSAGGIVIGGAITRRPDLFAAALDVVGVSDALRSEFSANGPSNIPEFGTIKDEKQFKTLLAIDAYQHVRNGVRYPAVMLVTGTNDPRVPSWELAKFAARLQSATTSQRPVLLRVDSDGGHGFLAASRTQTEGLLSDEYSFLLWQLGDPAFQQFSPTVATATATPEPGPTDEPTEKPVAKPHAKRTPLPLDEPMWPAAQPTMTPTAQPTDAPVEETVETPEPPRQ